MPHTQCPSTKGKRAVSDVRELSRVGGTGQKLWRSLEEVSDTPAFREFVEREFPSGASELLGESRREFIKLMGAGLALAGAATIPGCRRPDHKIMPYSKEVPEEAIPGKALYYATSMALPGGGAEGLIVETHEYRPTKVEGNPLHPLNQGKTGVWAQASVLGLYDPDRLKFCMYREGGEGEAKPASWDDFKHWWKERSGLSAKYAANGGLGLAFLVNKKSSPTREFVKESLMRRYPNAIFAVHEPATADAPIRGSQMAFGRPMREQLDLSRARAIVSIGRDFLNGTQMNEPGALANARDFASTRNVRQAGDQMSRLYVCETGFTISGASADHRRAMSPSDLARFTIALSRAVLGRLGGGGELGSLLGSMDLGDEGSIDGAFVEAAAGDLVEHQGASVVLAGPSLPAEIHALVHALNRLLGNVGRTVGYQPLGSDEAALSHEGLSTIGGAIDGGGVETLVCIDVNPVYDAPGELDFAAKFAGVRHTITLSVPTTETAVASEWALNGAHFLESWGDTRSIDGTIAPIQPMIAPLFDPAMSEIEFLAWLSGDERFIEQPAPVKDQFGRVIPAEDLPETNGHAEPRVSGRQIVRQTWQARGFVGGAFDAGFKRALHDGVVSGTQQTWTDAGVERAALFGAVTGALRGLELAPAPSLESLAVVIETAQVGDGRFANDAWLQELPQNGTRIVWDNPILLSPATAKALGVMPEPYIEKLPEGQVVSLMHEGRKVEVPVWILPGMADNCAIVTLGYGRTSSGVIGNGVGYDMNPLRGRGGGLALVGARVSKSGRGSFIASTQNHWSMEGRDSIVRQLDKKWFDAHAGAPIEVQEDQIYGRFEKQLNMAERLGELSHTPPNVSAYDNPFNESPDEPLEDARYSKRPQWGMSIDLSTCTGCGVCTIACQAENNIPVVGKKESGKGREMHWIRVDRYFTGDDPFHPEEMVHQPVPCVQCENAPCETVCPVNATSHGPEGINHMVYNRCIGTRYCANNCPYKVRRFNWMDYGQVKFNGGYVGEEALSAVGMDPKNQNLIPARLRARLDGISRMQRNPDVTVRSRGVMEKCNYCVQRINAARYETKLQDLENIPDGFFQSACQQACPSNAITFGDLLDESSAAREARDNSRSYLLLGFLNTRPRTTHMLRIRNPHPDLVSEDRLTHDPLAHGGHGGGQDGHGGDDHGPDDDGGGHSFLHNPRRTHEDSGYALSLKVLGSSTGVPA